MEAIDIFGLAACMGIVAIVAYMFVPSGDRNADNNSQH